jgi:hypothetical protein
VAEQRELRTARGDDVVLTLVNLVGEASTVLLSVRDNDDSAVPTAEFTMDETFELLHQLRDLVELGGG